MARRQQSSVWVWLMLFILVLVSSENCSGDDIYVPGDYATIQEAINAAIDYDRVIVADGLHSGNNSFGGKKIEVTSENGPGNCIISVSGWGRAFSFEQNEDPNSILDGFTITGGPGASMWGYGIYCDSSRPGLPPFVVPVVMRVFRTYSPCLEEGVA